REAELAGGFDVAGFAAWADGRFGALTALAALLLTGGDEETEALARRAGPVLGAAFALRHAAAMAGEGRTLLPALTQAELAELARGRATEGVLTAMQDLADGALRELSALRRERHRARRRAAPAFLPLIRAGRVLRRAVRLRRSGESAPDNAGRTGPRLLGGAPVGLGDLGHVDRPFDGLRLALGAATGRW